MRNAIACVSCLFVLIVSGCTKNDNVTTLEGSEPQRLSFGAPSAVADTFTKQMKNCWFEGPSAPLDGYRYDANQATLETPEGTAPVRQITIQSGPEPESQKFQVQFLPFNNNTLISTRNLSFPVELASRLKNDVETWIFGKKDCDDPASAASPAHGIAPQTSSSTIQQEQTGRWQAQEEPNLR